MSWQNAGQQQGLCEGQRYRFSQSGTWVVSRPNQGRDMCDSQPRSNHMMLETGAAPLLGPRAGEYRRV